MIDSQGRIVLVNREVERLFGYSREDLLGRSVDMLVPDAVRARHPLDRAAFLANPRERAMGHGRELHGLRKDGTEVPVEIGLTPVATEEGMFVISSVVDITARRQAEAERRLLEEQLRESQKLEALGTLAGGIAHDFNNLLGGIIGYAELVRAAVSSDAIRADLAELLQYAERGKQLIKQILIFSRQEARERRPLSLTRTVEEASRMLRATLPATIEMKIHVDPTVPRVLADATSVHQVLMNLANNAAHAMPAGGRLTIDLESFYVRDSIARANPDLHEGPYARLVVRDTGHGIEPGIRQRVFDPFFTTKGPNEGTGLGLAIVRGIMQDHGGAVRLESEVGAGTSVDCLFPALEVEPEGVSVPDESVPQGRGERILLVEDEEGLARLGRLRLESLGYEVETETDPELVLQRIAEATPFALMITDYNMPHLNGLDLARSVHAVHPALRILLTTGFVGDLPQDSLHAAGIVGLVRKPSTMAEIAKDVRNALDAPETS